MSNALYYPRTCFLIQDRSYKHLALKIYIQTPLEYTARNRELAADNHLSTLRNSHIGSQYIRDILYTFELVQPSGFRHRCFVHTPLHFSLLDLQTFRGKAIPLPVDMVRGAIQYLLQALDFLHTEAKLIHCGTHPFPQAILSPNRIRRLQSKQPPPNPARPLHLLRNRRRRTPPRQSPKTHQRVP